MDCFVPRNDESELVRNDMTTSAMRHCEERSDEAIRIKIYN